MNGKAGLSEQRALHLSEKLGLSPSEKEIFVTLALAKFSRSALGKKIASEKLSQYTQITEVIDEDSMAQITEWHYMALLELVSLNNIEHSVESFAKKLNIVPEMAGSAIERLERMGMLLRQDDKWVTATPERTTTRDIPSPAIRKFQHQLIGKAEEALDNQSVERRDFSAAVFAIDKEQLPAMKERIRQFRRELMKEFEATDNKNAVYSFCVQLFELTE